MMEDMSLSLRRHNRVPSLCSAIMQHNNRSSFGLMAEIISHQSFSLVSKVAANHNFDVQISSSLPADFITWRGNSLASV